MPRTRMLVSGSSISGSNVLAQFIDLLLSSLGSTAAARLLSEELLQQRGRGDAFLTNSGMVVDMYPLVVRWHRWWQTDERLQCTHCFQECRETITCNLHL
ncbi:hypothetical protein MPTK1_8g10740 [Marchantia polymorpha subsp. ruderalis]|uniref:Uncharacterized protein n=1 Tax=Marchantia polymorpha TaxID=3197 RepID=A0A2R6XMP8_MARPO|nr:hypothetical protein MARPO_0008s0149 [Marchantia polymorpha]BBN19445.1 hypothetical protein Mp_8g10740 [Marchantia polymorpha subsp. ruderalis]|eukprot:PTQ47387.1 hypothetical protein MARPO_0008s0149 [Marchantia polymorpha]